MPRSWTWIIPKHSAWCRTPCAGAWGIPGDPGGSRGPVSFRGKSGEKPWTKPRTGGKWWENRGKMMGKMISNDFPLPMISNDFFHAMFDYCGVDIQSEWNLRICPILRRNFTREGKKTIWDYILRTGESRENHWSLFTGLWTFMNIP